MPVEPRPLQRGSLLQPIHARVLREEILDILRSAIVTGGVQPGSRLVEDEIAARMGTSRVPVREAIRQLEQEGLVELAPHRGAVVASVAEAEVDALYEIRATIEAEAFRRACGRAGEADFATLGRLVADLEHALRMADLPQLSDIDRRFHEAVLGVAGFGVARRLWRTADGLIRMRTFRRLASRPPGGRDYLAEIADRHRLLIDAIRSGDAEVAAAAARHHVLDVHRDTRADGGGNTT